MSGAVSMNRAVNVLLASLQYPFCSFLCCFVLSSLGLKEALKTLQWCFKPTTFKSQTRQFDRRLQLSLNSEYWQTHTQRDMWSQKTLLTFFFCFYCICLISFLVLFKLMCPPALPSYCIFHSLYSSILFSSHFICIKALDLGLLFIMLPNHFSHILS